MPIVAVVLSLLLAHPESLAASPREAVTSGPAPLSSSIVPERPSTSVGVRVAQMARMARIQRQKEAACEKIRKRVQETLNRKGNSAKRAARLADLQRQKDEKRCDF